MPPWVKFKYRDFYDVPRQVLVESNGSSYLLDCRFDAARDQYADEYEILEMPSLASDVVRESTDLRRLARRFLGRVAVQAVRFDPTLRSQIDLASIPAIASQLPISEAE